MERVKVSRRRRYWRYDRRQYARDGPSQPRSGPRDLRPWTCHIRWQSRSGACSPPCRPQRGSATGSWSHPASREVSSVAIQHHISSIVGMLDRLSNSPGACRRRWLYREVVISTRQSTARYQTRISNAEVNMKRTLEIARVGHDDGAGLLEQVERRGHDEMVVMNVAVVVVVGNKKETIDDD
jgi:hypothetical protein